MKCAPFVFIPLQECDSLLDLFSLMHAFSRFFSFSSCSLCLFTLLQLPCTFRYRRVDASASLRLLGFLAAFVLVDPSTFSKRSQEKSGEKVGTDDYGSPVREQLIQLLLEGKEAGTG